MAAVANVKANDIVTLGVNNNDNYYISLASDAYSGSLNIELKSIGGPNRMGVIDNNLKVATDDPQGYRLYVNTANNYADLVKAGETKKIQPVSGSIASPSALTSNTWGYALDADKTGTVSNGFDASYDATTPSTTALYSAMPSAQDTPSLVRKTTTENTDDVYDSFAVHYATRIDLELPRGVYENEVVYTAMTETTASIGDYTGYSEPNSIEIDANMIPIKYTGDETTPEWQKADITNTNNDWFSYTDKKWANAVTVTSATLDDYKSAPVGTPIAEADVMGYFVYIPRYRYVIQGAMTQDNASQLGQLTYAKRQQTPRDFDIEFQDPGDPKFINNKINTWYTQPAFSFGDCTAGQDHCYGDTIELGGIWMGKFETTGVNNAATVKPNISSLRSQSFENQFNTSQLASSQYSLSSYTDSRVSRDSDWGAAAYLATSKYGKGAANEVWINPSSSYITGCAGTGPSVNSSTGCEYNYYTTYGVQASTTGNVYGIYDMSGGAYDRTAITSGSSIVNKYYDNYTIGTGSNSSVQNCQNVPYECLGHALYETTGWSSDSTSFNNSSPTRFGRGGLYSGTANSGLFSVYVYNTSSNPSYTFRLTMSVF